MPGAGGTAKLTTETNAASVIVPAITALYRRIVNPAYVIRRVGISCNNVVEDQGALQLNMFEDVKYSLQGTTQGRYLTGGVPPVRFSM